MLPPCPVPPAPRSVSFNIYNASGDGGISKAELTDMLTQTLRENEILITPAQVCIAFAPLSLGFVCVCVCVLSSTRCAFPGSFLHARLCALLAFSLPTRWLR